MLVKQRKMAKYYIKSSVFGMRDFLDNLGHFSKNIKKNTLIYTH